ncbi:MAG: sugar porter family MFS transporter [Chlamydiales bacterium]
MATDEENFMMSREQLSPYGKLAICAVTLGGFLFGFYAAVISGALCFICRHFSLSTMHEATIVSVLLLGACIGTLAAGYLTDRVGRKKTIIISALFFLCGALVFVYASKFSYLIIGRTLAGFAIGLVSVSVPLYLSEISPPHARGKIVALNTLAIAVGIFFSYGVNYYFSPTEDWRTMFGIGVIPAAILFGAMLFLPETPEWLISHRGVEKTKKALRWLRNDKLWEARIDEMKNAAVSAKANTEHRLFTPALKFPLIVGVMMHVFQQITGFNGVIYFAPKIFASAGFDLTSTAVLATMGIGAVNFLATFVALRFIDRAGRRPLLLIGIAGMALSLIGLSAAFYFDSPFIGIISFVCILAYVGFFAIGLGPIPWLLISEIYPLSVRGKAMSIAALANWFFSFLVAQIFLGMINVFGSEGTFFLFATLSLLALFFVYQYVPETKGKSLEEIALQMRRRA